MRFIMVLPILISVCCITSVAKASSVVGRVKARGVVRCGSVGRPGLASVGDEKNWTGLNVDVCRGIAAAVLGSPELIEYHVYETPTDFDAVRNHQDDVYFLTGSEINEQKLAGKVVPGPVVFVESHAVMTMSTSTVHHIDDLAGDSICFMIGSPAERSLSARFEAIKKGWLHRPFSARW